MARTVDFTIPAHPSIYQPAERNMNITFAYPEHDVRSDTKLLLLISSYGENKDSQAFKQARERLADELNVVVIQCDYFGSEFMQGVACPDMNQQKERLGKELSEEDYSYVYQSADQAYSRLLRLGRNYQFNLEFTERFNESSSNFNDMSVMQAVDNITAVLAVMSVLDDNGLSYDHNHTMIYGTGHGGYIGYLCNAYAPWLFSELVDNSGWLTPAFISRDQIIYTQSGGITVKFNFEYLIKRMEIDRDIINLEWLYKRFHNKCNIYSFHGEEDGYTLLTDKQYFCNSILTTKFTAIRKPLLNSPVIQSCSFGLGVEYVEFFKWVYIEHISTSVREHMPGRRNHLIQTSSSSYSFDYINGMPIVTKEGSSSKKGI